ncbi:condensin-2 complex subunit D3-like isoform X2 [Triticum urartu]|uniref:condensin-2 complex subunit D3-like isoform X2 n=1 Tax=Triticum urartu TaxID=4572 RepID=UPI0020441D67|nr:condensin-2 complex subunit D3-like isoform X2 [Triticum urartu]XP_048532432.1 condensin-2 complex subunit D3-like isoform X2 [Triticum urartu]
MDADDMDVDEIDSPASASGSLSAFLSELAALHRRASSSSSTSTSPPLSLPSLTLLSSPATAASLFPRLAAAGLPASSLLLPLTSSFSAHPIPALTAYLRLLLAPASPLASLFSPLPFLSFLLALRKAATDTHNPSAASDSGNAANPRKRKNQRQQAATRPPSFLPQALSLLADAAGRLPLGEYPDALRSLIDTAAELAAFNVLAAVLGSRYHAEAVQDVIRALVPLVLSGGKSAVRSSAVEFLVRKIVPLGADEEGEEEGIRKVVGYLPRLLAVKAPEKSEARGLAVEAIVEVVQAMEPLQREGFAAYLVAMSRGKAKGRLFAVDMVLAMLPVLLPSEIDESGLQEGSWGLKCVQVLVERCSDSAGAVRARALTNAAHALDVLSERGVEVDRLQEVMKIGNMGLGELLRRRCIDDKAAVRKAALVLITKAIGLIGRPVDESLLTAMGAACSDPLVTIRKAALAAISEVFRKFPDESVTKEWLQAVPSLMIDSETSIQEECENLFLELVLNRVCQAANLKLDDDSVNLEELFPDGTLDLLKSICDGEVVPCIKRICASLGKKKKLRPMLASSLQNIITISETLWLRSSKPIENWTAPAGAWWLLSEVSSFAPKSVNWKFLSHHWKLLDNVGQEGKGKASSEGEPNSALWAVDRVSLLQTISNVSMELPVEPAAELAHSLLTRIENFDMNLSEVDAHVKSLKTLCKRKAKTAKEAEALIMKWVQQLINKAVDNLERYIKGTSQDSRGCSYNTPLTGKLKGRKEASTSKEMSEAVIAVFTVGSVILACPDASVQGIIPLLHTVITSGNPEPRPTMLAGGAVSFNEVAPSLYIQSWDTMAKICLVDDKLAKRYIPLFVQELERSDLATLRNNIMIAMADFYVRYTALVDCYMSKITKVLRDPCEVVRRQTFVLLAKLLQRDYVKWRGVLFLRFLPSLVDESDKIRHLADYLFGSILKAKAPLLAYNSFIEAIYVLNNCTGHGGYSESQSQSQSSQGSQSSDRGQTLFAIRGTDESSRSKRMHIYVSLLKQMAPEHLLATSAKLCAEILAGVCDGLLSVDDAAGRAVVQDALQILACKEMRIHPSILADNSEMDDDGGDGGTANALQAAKGRAVTQVAKKNLIQIAIPIFIELKRLLESKNSPLTGCLMECLRTLLKDYKNEFDEILVADKQLQKELLYDMQKFEAGKGKSSRDGEAAGPSRSSPAAPDPGDAAAKATARSVLKEMNRNVPTPPLHTMSVPKVKSVLGTGALSGSRRPAILESVRRLEPFGSDDEN